MPALLALPSSTTAYYAFVRLQSFSLTQLRSLSAASAGSLLLAYTLSPRYGRHPYLLWTVLTVAISAGSDLWLSRDARALLMRENKRRAGDVLADSPQPNGEEVKQHMEEFRIAQAVRAGIASLGFVMSVVGIWGDGF